MDKNTKLTQSIECIGIFSSGLTIGYANYLYSELENKLFFHDLLTMIDSHK